MSGPEMVRVTLTLRRKALRVTVSIKKPPVHVTEAALLTYMMNEVFCRSDCVGHFKAILVL